MVAVSSIEKALMYVSKNPQVKKFKSKSGEVFENLGNGCLSKTITKPFGSTVRVDYTGRKLNSLFEQTENGCFRLYPNGIITGMTDYGSFSANLHGDYLSFVDRSTNKVSQELNVGQKVRALMNYIRHGSTNEISVNTAMEYFKKNPQATYYIPKQNFMNTGVRYVKGTNGQIKKLVTKYDEGKNFVGTFVNGKFVRPNAASSRSINIKTIKPVGEDKISITYIQNGKEKTISAPKYLYHFTSTDNAKLISQSGELRISQAEQVKGLYLLDSENFLERYDNVILEDGKSRDLLTAIFRQATKGNMQGNKIAIYKIPTESLLSNGKLLIRTQEEFMEFQANKLLKIFQELKKKNIIANCTPRDLADDFNRSELRRLVVENKIMSEKEIDALISDMTAKLHHGHSFFDCEKLSKTNAVEYVYNNSIPTNDFAKMGITSKTINVDDYLVNGRAIDPLLARRIFN